MASLGPCGNDTGEGPRHARVTSERSGTARVTQLDTVNVSLGFLVKTLRM
jgi:hypothetical protein